MSARDTILNAGFDELLYLLEALPRRMQNPMTRSVVGKASRLMAKKVRAEIPVDEGLLKKAQGSKVRTKKGQTTGWVGAVVEKMREQEYARSGSVRRFFHAFLPAKNPRPTNIDYLVNKGHVAGATDAFVLRGLIPVGTWVPGAFYMERAARWLPEVRNEMEEMFRHKILDAMTKKRV